MNTRFGQITKTGFVTTAFFIFEKIKFSNDIYKPKCITLEKIFWPKIFRCNRGINNAKILLNYRSILC